MYKANNHHSKKYGAQSLSSLLPKITKPIFEKYGFATSDLIAQWPNIVGQDFARTTRPEKLKWPHYDSDIVYDGEKTSQSEGHRAQKPSHRRRSDIFANINSKGKPPHRTGATLILRVESVHSLEVQFASAQIIARINTYFGYEAVTDIRILQAPFVSSKTAQTVGSQTYSKSSPFSKHPEIQIPPQESGPSQKSVVKIRKIKNMALKQALERMALGVSSRQPKE